MLNTPNPHTRIATLLCWLIANLHVPLSVQAQVRMESLGVEEGLSQGFITSIIQDKRGFIWMGTYDGLNRYDGYTVRRFTTRPFDNGALQSSYITYLFEDNRQLLWVGTHQGLHVFDPLTERFYYLSLPEHQLPAGHVEYIHVAKNGDVFVQIPTDHTSTGVFHIKMPPDILSRLRTHPQPFEGVLAKPLITAENLPCKMVACLGDTMPLMYDLANRWFGFSPALQALVQVHPLNLPKSPTHDHNILWGKYLGYVYRWETPNGHDTLIFSINNHTVLPMTDGHIAIWIYPQGPLLRKNNTDPIRVDFSRRGDTLLRDPLLFQEFTILLDSSRHWGSEVFVDRRGTIWVATGGLGVRKVLPHQLAFKGLFPGLSISAMRELPDGRLWIRRFSEESFVFNRITGECEPPPWGVSNWCHEVFVDSAGDYWLVENNRPPYSGKRILRYEHSTDRLTRFSEVIPFINGVLERVLEDQSGNIWLAAHHGILLRCQKGGSKLERFSFAEIANNNPINLRTTAFTMDKNGVLWIGTNRGLVRVDDYNTRSPRFRFFKHHPEHRQSLSIDWVTSICPDPNSANILWLGTRGGGINRLNTMDHTFSYIAETPNGLPDNVVYGILPDDNGNLWCSTNRGLCRFNPATNTFVTYRESDGLLSTEFNTNSYLRTRDGSLWFGGVSGLNYFQPAEIHANVTPPEVAITGIKVRGTPRLPDTENALSLTFEDNNVLFEFAAFDYTNPATNRFRHRLRDIDKDWVNDGTAHSANYAALPPGEYVFELQGATADSPWSETTVFRLTIRPPWYRSWLAHLAYALLFVTAVWGIIRYREKMFRLEHSAEANLRESVRLKAFETVKNQFFANVAHELRTPLTVILGLAKRLNHRSQPEEIERSAHNIVEQGNMLLNLTNQILDLAKLESQHFSLQLFNGNISQFVEEHTNALAPLAQSKGLQLLVENKNPNLWMDFDPVQLQKILNNLISNAVRHSNPEGNIWVKTQHEEQQNTFQIAVEDSGEGIAAADLPRIFERFFQSSRTNARTGASGIGLTITRDLVRLMGGDIRVESVEGHGARFAVELPIQNQAPRLTEKATPIPIERTAHHTAVSSKNANLPLLLVVEDNEAVANFLTLCLQDHYRLELATDGALGIARALELIPDLILTDVAMPGKNGFELCSLLKQDLRTSHIPVVMMTAKVEPHDRLEGKRSGANAYLTKPFEEQELLLVIKNLLHLQEQWKQRYAQLAAGSAAPNLAQTGHSHADMQYEDAFMKRLFTLFKEHYPDEQFNLERLCRLLGMSSSQLDRKLKVLTDRSPMQMLRSFRLQKARAMLLQQPKLSVKDVCYRTGFKSPSHFSKAFSEEFGVPPSELGEV